MLLISLSPWERVGGEGMTSLKPFPSIPFPKGRGGIQKTNPTIRL